MVFVFYFSRALRDLHVLTPSFPSRRSSELFEVLGFTLPPGGIVGVIGPNGAGKSTLFKIITGKEKPDSGTVEIGSTVHLGYVDQSRDHLDPKNNVWQEIRSEEHTSELQSLMRISYAVF